MIVDDDGGECPPSLLRELGSRVASDHVGNHQQVGISVG